jgi:glycine cleavage system H protein
MSQVIENLLYTEDHEWIKVDGKTASIGITDFAQNSLGDIVFVELPDIDEDLSEGSTFGVVESIKSVSDLYTPLSGKVVEKNDKIEESPEQINQDAFNSWLIKIQLNDESELTKLMDANKYKIFCEENS